MFRICEILTIVVLISVWYPEASSSSEREGDEFSLPGVTSRNVQKGARWPNRTVLYTTIHSTCTKIKATLGKISSKTCITFQERKTEQDYIDFVDSKTGKFHSMLGKVGGGQKIGIPKSRCGERTILHGVLHALGLHHEFNRPDRDRYITIRGANPGSYFKKKTCDEVDLFGTTFDFDSVMMPERHTAMISRKDGKPLKLATTLSKGDIYRLKRAYDCFDV